MSTLLDKSEESWHASCVLFREQWNDAAASRLYYAVFQAVFGLGIKQGKMDIEHTDRPHQRAQRVARDNGPGHYYFKIVRKLYAMRIRADYKAERVGRDEMQSCWSEAQDAREFFIKEIEK